MTLIQSFKPQISWQTYTGDAVTVGDMTLRPQSQALVIRSPFGGFVWNRPAAIRIKQGEQETSIPIVDVTRIAQAGMLALTVLFSIFASIAFARRRRSDERRA